MKLLLDDEGHVVVQDGMPVYVHDDGKEMPLDAPALIKSTNNFADERSRYHNKIKGFENQLAAYNDADGNPLDPESVHKALSTVKNLSEKELYTAEKVEIMKQKMGETFENDRKTMVTAHEQAMKEKEAEIQKLHNDARDLMVRNAFSQSELFSGPKPLTRLTPDIAAAYFDKNFKVEGEGADAKLVGVLDGEVIPSQRKYGQPADFDEAIEVIISKYPYKDRIMNNTKGGPGGDGNTHHRSDGRTITISRQDAMDTERYRTARAAAEKAGTELRITD